MKLAHDSSIEALCDCDVMLGREERKNTEVDKIEGRLFVYTEEDVDVDSLYNKYNSQNNHPYFKKDQGNSTLTFFQRMMIDS